ncbi:cytochrome P450 [Halobacteriales archaeon QS_1_67_19]|nr:MAG: cytochrome P450 [Halobacteriales archaeon QS_1_67_19]
MSHTTPPAPDGLPILGHTVRFAREQAALFESAADGGEVVKLRILGMGNLHLLSNPEDIADVLVRGRDAFGKPSFSKDQLGDLLGNGLVLSEGEFWQRQRGLMQPAFYRNRIESYAEYMTDHARQTADSWVAGRTYDAADEMKKLTLRIFVDAMFGTDVDYEKRGIRDAVAALQEPAKPRKQIVARVVPKWVPIPMWREYMSSIEFFEDLIAEMLAEKRTESGDGRGTGDDLLSMLLRARDEGGEGMTDEQVRDELMTMLFAGHETTALALTYTWYLLGRNPEKARTLREELDAELDGPPTAEDLPALDYTEAVVKESMRVYPPVPMIPREAETDVEIAGYRVPEGEMVACPQVVAHHDDRWWNDPEQFRPERWLDDQGELADGTGDRPEYAYFPFGGGPRRCIGEEFAMVEGQLILATLAREWEVELASEAPPNPAMGPTLLPMNDIEITPRAR